MSLPLPRRALPALGAALAAPRLAAAQAPRVLRFVPQSDLGVLDPIWSAAYVTRNHALMVFDTLYGMDADYRIQPQMAEGHTVSDDGLAWTIRLREELRFHDGMPVLARDAVASIRRWGARDGLGQSLLAATEALEAVDDRTLRFRLKRRFPLLTYALGKPGSPVCVVMPERLALTDPFRQVTEMVGSGPFRFLAEERVSGARVAYARNADYLPRSGGAASFTAGPKRVHLDRVEWIVMPDPSTAAAALRAGEVDWWENPSFDLLPMLARDRRLALTVQDPLGFIGCLRFNHLIPPFDNPAIRRAVLPALSQADYMAAVAGDFPGGWNQGIGFFAPGTPMANDEGMATLTGPRDLEAAKRALAAAGYRGERVAVPAPSDFPTLKAMADIGADLLQRIGFAVDYQAADWGTVVQRLAKMDPVDQGGWNVFHTFWSGQDMLDPAVHQYLRGNGRAARSGWPTSAALEAMREAWMAAEAETDRLRIARAMQARAFEDLPYIPVGQILPRFAHRREVTDVPGGFAIFWTVRKAA
ncbi:ABC transporter substrate-binding protein [Paracraurococcus lichenis]|uniref:ABC transporter substrate-binding protein n=1 Tax=Paracraurococcus lichenis TaxID=3064888 RepID=A0ABT9DSN9_9PROT|nr:ABC transporter substrate-binding protein [Paracraurococcus sp. LOR1-02]MDO9706912.1 ABC transporter substrate-binding protein [Paracraurococcus sp. LOR1-02]